LGTAAVLLAVSAVPGVWPVTPIWEVTLMNAKWYALGLCAGVAWTNQSLMRRIDNKALAALWVATFLGLQLVHQRIEGQFGSVLDTAAASSLARMSWGTYAVPVAFVGSLTLVATAARLSGRAKDVLAFLGQCSMAIFVLHVMMGAGTRIASQHMLGVQQEGMLLLLITTAGVVGPLVVLYVISHLGLDRYLGVGRWPSGGKAPPQRLRASARA
jgi:hypothetical protein